MREIRYSAEYPTNDRQLVIDWCIATYGNSTDLKGRWFPLGYTIQFENQADRDWFMLMWS